MSTQELLRFVIVETDSRGEVKVNSTDSNHLPLWLRPFSLLFHDDSFRRVSIQIYGKQYEVIKNLRKDTGA